MDIFSQHPAKAMAIAAHPDDIELWAGGTLARWIAGGAEVTAVICTDGSAGSTDPVLAREIAHKRKQEQDFAAAELGLHHVSWLGYPDGGVEDTAAFRGRLVRLVREYRPEFILTHDPASHRRFLHRDHRIVGQVALDAIYPYARDPLHFPEQLSETLRPHKVSSALLWESDDPDVLVDIASVMDQKLRALECHQSQLAGLLSSDGDAPGISELLLMKAREAAAGSELTYAESFRLVIAPR